MLECLCKAGVLAWICLEGEILNPFTHPHSGTSAPSSPRQTSSSETHERHQHVG